MKRILSLSMLLVLSTGSGLHAGQAMQDPVVMHTAKALADHAVQKVLRNNPDYNIYVNPYSYEQFYNDIYDLAVAEGLLNELSFEESILARREAHRLAVGTLQNKAFKDMLVGVKASQPYGNFESTQAGMNSRDLKEQLKAKKMQIIQRMQDRDKAFSQAMKNMPKQQKSVQIIEAQRRAHDTAQRADREILAELEKEFHRLEGFL